MAWDIRPVIVLLILVSSLQHIWYFSSSVTDDAGGLEDPSSTSLRPGGGWNDGHAADSGAAGGHLERWPRASGAIPPEDDDREGAEQQAALGANVAEIGGGAGWPPSPRAAWQSMWQKLAFLNRIMGSGASPPPGLDVPFFAPNTGEPGGIGRPSYDNWTLYMWDETPLLLHQALFDAPGCTRGGYRNEHGVRRSGVLRYIGASDGLLYPWRPPDEADLLEEDLVETEEKFNYPWDIIDKLPHNDTGFAFRTCALVSNSGSLLDARFGEEIDEHDAVFRMNNAPTLDFEQHVGRKTTFDLLNRPHAEAVSRMSQPPGPLPEVAAVLFEADNFHLYHNILQRQLQHMPYPSTLVLSPPFLNRVNALWMRLAKRWPRYANSCEDIKKASMLGEDSQRCKKNLHDCQNHVCKPSSGFFALLLASQMCNSIDMYGFESYRGGSGKKAKYHYFDEEEGITTVHSFVLIMKVFEFLSHRYNITIKTPQYDPEKERALEIKERSNKQQESTANKQSLAFETMRDSEVMFAMQQIHARQKAKALQKQIFPVKQQALLKSYSMKRSSAAAGEGGAAQLSDIRDRAEVASVRAAKLAKLRASGRADLYRSYRSLKRTIHDE